MKQMFRIILGLIAVECVTLGQLRFTSDDSGNPTAIQSGTAAPSVSIPKGTQTVFVGEPFAISANASGSGPIVYQWKLNGVNISGATNATYFKASSTLNDAGNYSVFVSNSVGNATHTAGTITVLPSAQGWFAVAYGGSKYVAIGNEGTIGNSTDLIKWNSPLSNTTNQLNGIVYGGSKFVAVGDNGTVITSTDGTTWASQSSGNTNHLNAIAYGNSTFVAVGANGTVLTSANGTTWTTRTFDTLHFQSVAFGNGKFVAVGTSGTIWVSTSNGVAWNNYTYATAATLRAAMYANSKFWAGGDDGLLLSSTDAISWTRVALDSRGSIQALAYANGTLFAFGPTRTVYMSADGIHWGAASSGSKELIRGAVTVGTSIVGVGDWGAILTIPYAQLDHFTFNSIPIAQKTSQSFTVTILAKDAANNTISGYSGSVPISATALSAPVSATLLGNTSATPGTASTNTYGYSFTPDKDLLLTHFRTFFGKKVGIWNVHQQLIASVPITAAAGSWTLTALNPPLPLLKDETYIIAAYSESSFAYRTDGLSTFGDGSLNQALYEPGLMRAPRVASTNRWYLVDLQYTVQRQQPLSISPTSANFSSGSATVSASFGSAANHVVIQASDVAGRTGVSNPFNVYASNDLAVTMSDSADPISVSTPLTYTVTVFNPTSSAASNVLVTNTLPANVSNVSATSTHGTPVLASGKITCNMGTIAAQSSATLSITVTPTLAGAMLATTTTAKKAETDSDLNNNVATQTTYVLPVLTASGISITEGNLTTAIALPQLTVSPATPYTVWFDAASANGIAAAGFDYDKISGTFAIPPNTTIATLPVDIIGDTIGEGNETFYLNLTNPRNASLGTSQITVTINNDDGIAGQVDAFAWSTIFTPKRVDAAFAATITAKDHLNGTVTSFTGTNSLTAFEIGGSTTNLLLTNTVSPSVANDGTYTFGYSFTPNTNIVVTHLRHFSGSKVMLWTKATRSQRIPLWLSKASGRRSKLTLSCCAQGSDTASVSGPPGSRITTRLAAESASLMERSTTVTIHLEMPSQTQSTMPLGTWLIYAIRFLEAIHQQTPEAL